MRDILDLDRFPIDQPGAPGFRKLVNDCQDAMRNDGMFNLDGFLRPAAIARAVGEIQPLMHSHSFAHQRRHNVYFKDRVEGLRPDHVAVFSYYERNGVMFSEAERVGFYGRAG